MQRASADVASGATTARTRLIGPDAVRFAAFSAVVVLHAIGDTAGSAGLSVVGNAMRFAVPFFFLLSGYFLSTTAPFGAIAWRTVRRLVPVFLVWLVVYMWATGDLGSLARPAQMLRYLVTGGPAYHLWFLPALGAGIAIVAALRRFTIPLALLAAAFLVFGLAFGAYRQALGLPDLPINSRNGPIFSMPFIALGYFAARLPVPSFATGAALAVVGLTIQCVESFLLSSGWQAAGTADYFLGTVPFAFGVLVVSLRFRETSAGRWAADLGQATLWMYCIHALILMLLPSPMEGLPLIIATIGGSMLSAALVGSIAYRLPVLTPFVH